jgi:multiple sugar transport system ATP-binding protein
MKDGHIQQIDTPRNLYHFPKNLFVAEFMGSPQMNNFNAIVNEREGDIYLNFHKYSMKLPTERVDVLKNAGYIDNEIIIGVRPEDLHDDDRFINTTQNTVIEADVEVAEFLGSEMLLYLVVGNIKLTARVSPDSNINIGDKIKIAININKIHCFDIDSKIAI